MVLENDPEVLATFRGEAEDRLQELESGLARLRTPDADLSTEVHDLFRAAHSLKATSNLLGFAELERLAKRLEDRLQDLRRNPAPPDDQAMEEFVRYLDEIGLIIDTL